MARKRVLISSEFGGTASGFAVYSKHLCEELSKHYELAEIASYGGINDPRDTYVGDWKYYPVLPDEKNPQEQENYKKNKLNQFGLWRWEPTLLDFQPDIVLSLKDSSMSIHEHMSPLREYYHWINSPAIDSAPQKDDFLAMFEDADALITYSDYGYGVIKDELNNPSNLFGVAYPGVSDEFKPLNKEQIRREFDIPQEWILVGFVSRNQRRKLFLDLLDSYKIYLERVKNKNPELYKNTYLYFHTSIIDLSPFDIVKYLRLTGLADRVLFTYKCQSCKHAYCDFFKGAKTVCLKCKDFKAITPTVAFGLTREEVAKIYNLLDVAVQYSICGGSEFSIQEAASCAVVPMSTNATAMQDSIKLLGGIPINIERIFHDIELGAIRYLPDNNDFVDKLIEFLKLPRQIRMKRGFECHQLARKHFNWENNAKVWIDAIENLSDKPKKDWSDPYPDITPNFNIPEGLSNKGFVYYCIDNVLCKPEFKYTHTALNALRNLDNGIIIDGGNVREFTREDFFNYCKSRVMSRIYWEDVRCGRKIMPPQKFIEYCHIKNMLKDHK